MAIKKENGDWLDAAGNSVPKKYIDKLEQKKDALIEKLIKLALEESTRLANLKKTANELIDAYLDTAAKEAGLEENPGGNYTLTGFSGNVQVERKRVGFIDFDEKLQFAKAKIDSCISRWSKNADDNLRVVIYDAFKVDKKGRVDKNRLLGLRRLNIKDQEWHAAMELISDAIIVVSKREYLSFRIKNDKGEWDVIPLDLARV